MLRDLFCGDAPQKITGLTELQAALHVGTEDIGGLRGLSLTAHSTAVAARSVSAINPRVLSFQLDQPLAGAELVVVAFVRGEQTVEMVVRDRQSAELQFYLLKYRQACNEEPEGCLPGDLLTPVTEEGWVEVSLYDEEDLKNTIVDCRQCHQPDGVGTTKLLRMQELKMPWTHWLYNSTGGGRILLSDYRAAHGDETYGGMTSERIEWCNPGSLELLVSYANGVPTQPNEFMGKEIEAEVSVSRQQAGDTQRPEDWLLRQSDTWRSAYELAREGQAIPVPYPEIRVTDPDKLAEMTAAYADYRAGSLSRNELPDIRDVFPDDPFARAAMGFGAEPGLDPQEILVQACGQCHNDRLDQKLSRARFNVDLDQLSRAQKDAAIERLYLPATDLHAMPPVLVRSLSADDRASLVELLRR